MLRSVIHLELILHKVQGLDKGSFSINVHLFLAPFVEKSTLSKLNWSCTFVKNQCGSISRFFVLFY